MLAQYVTIVKLRVVLIISHPVTDSFVLLAKGECNLLHYPSHTDSKSCHLGEQSWKVGPLLIALA
jgi:hypothetical protein